MQCGLNLSTRCITRSVLRYNSSRYVYWNALQYGPRSTSHTRHRIGSNVHDTDDDRTNFFASSKNPLFICRATIAGRKTDHAISTWGPRCPDRPLWSCPWPTGLSRSDLSKGIKMLEGEAADEAIIAAAMAATTGRISSSGCVEVWRT